MHFWKVFVLNLLICIRKNVFKACNLSVSTVNIIQDTHSASVDNNGRENKNIDL